jgi:hypothetical protein
MADSPPRLTIRKSIQHMRWIAIDMRETVRLTRSTIHKSRCALAEADRCLGTGHLRRNVDRGPIIISR